MSNNVIIQFLVELIQRWRSKSPTFFKVIQWIAIGVTLFSGLPELLDQLNVTLPEWATILQSKVAGIVGFVSFLLAALPVEENPPVVEEATPAEAKKTVSLPFTEHVDKGTSTSE